MASVGLFTNVKSGKNLLDFMRYGQRRRLKRFRSIVKDGNAGRVYITGLNSDYLTDLENKVVSACSDKP